MSTPISTAPRTTSPSTITGRNGGAAPRPRPNDDLAGFVADQPGPEESAVDADALARLREIVAELPPRTREIFRLNRLEGLTHAEVARRLEISDSSVQKHLARALAHVMQALEDSR
ncbi:TPA: RNA polymerase sigma factor [Pseudomonas aeruginosa]